ncbi:MAG: dTDP-4-dehydrorhamnose reductase [Gammaproteobacteria bacterium]
MKALLTGAGGQLGRELLDTKPPTLEMTALDHSALDVSDPERVKKTVISVRPDVIVNAAAYTAVDRAELEPEAADAVNRRGVENLAAAAQIVGARIIHISTDYVFDGEAERPYRPADRPAPLSVYGATKLAGERALQESRIEDSIIIRTSWLYSVYENNFVKNMLRLMREKSELCVVSDQTGTPTWARNLAAAVWEFTGHPEAHGVYHWTDGGSATWLDFALAIQAEGMALGLLARSIPIHPIASSEFQAKALRPRYSVLDCAGSRRLLASTPDDWRASLHRMMAGLRAPE